MTSGKFLRFKVAGWVRCLAGVSRQASLQVGIRNFEAVRDCVLGRRRKNRWQVKNAAAVPTPLRQARASALSGFGSMSGNHPQLETAKGAAKIVIPKPAKMSPKTALMNRKKPLSADSLLLSLK